MKMPRIINDNSNRQADTCVFAQIHLLFIWTNNSNRNNTNSNKNSNHKNGYNNSTKNHYYYYRSNTDNDDDDYWSSSSSSSTTTGPNTRQGYNAQEVSQCAVSLPTCAECWVEWGRGFPGLSSSPPLSAAAVASLSGSAGGLTITDKTIHISSSSSAFPSYISGVHHFWVRFLRMWLLFNPTIKLVTFRLCGSIHI